MSWYFKTGGATQGPMERDALVDLLRKGILTPQVEVSEDKQTWCIAPQVPGLMNEVLASSKQTQPAPATQPEVASPTPPVQPATTPAVPTPPASQSTAIAGPSTAIAGPPSAAAPASPTQAQATTASPAAPSTAIAGPNTSIAGPPLTSVAGPPLTSVAGPPLTAPALSEPTPTSPTLPEALVTESPSSALPSPVATPSAPSPLPTEPVDPSTAPQQPEELPESEDDNDEQFSSDTSIQDTSDEPTGPVAHITLDPSARQKSRSKQPSGGVAKLAISGVLGLAVLAGIGLVVAFTVFGIDLRPAKVDQNVSKYMLEGPKLVVSINPEAVLKAQPIRELSKQGGAVADLVLGYAKDAENILIVSDRLDAKAPNFLGVAKLKRDYRAEFVANMFRNGTTKKIGNYTVHSASQAGSGEEYAACLPDARTFIFGTPKAVESVLRRDAFPKLYPRESELIADTIKNTKAVRASLFLDTFKPAVAKLKATVRSKYAELDENQLQAMKGMMGDMEQMTNDLDYAVKNIRFASIDLEFDKNIHITTSAECGSKRKAKRITESMLTFINTSPVAKMAASGSKIKTPTPIAKGTTIEATTSIDLSEISNAFTAGLGGRGF